MNVNADAAGNVPLARQRGWYHGWNIVAIAVLSMTMANGLTYNAFSLFLKPLSAELHTPISSLTLSLAGLAFGGALLSPFVGPLADRLPARRLLSLGLLGIALFYVCVGSATAVWQIWALYWVLGTVSLTFSTAVVTNAVIARWFVRRRGLALGLSAFGMGLAGVVLPPLIQRILPELGWRMIWRGCGVLIALVVVPLVLWLIRDRPTEAEGHYYMSGEAGVSGAHHGRSAAAGRMGWREVLARRNFWLLLGIYIPMVALNGAIIQNISPYAATRGLSAQFGASLLALLSLAHVLATPLLGMLSDRFGNRLPFVGMAVVLIAGALLLALNPTVPLIVVGCVLIGIGGGWFTLLGAAIAVEFGADNVGRGFGMCMLFVPLASSASYVLAKTQETTGSYAPALIGMAAAVAVSGALSLMLRERQSGDLHWA
jgi:MFS family permease